VYLTITLRTCEAFELRATDCVKRPTTHFPQRQHRNVQYAENERLCAGFDVLLCVAAKIPSAKVKKCTAIFSATADHKKA